MSSLTSFYARALVLILLLSVFFYRVAYSFSEQDVLRKQDQIDRADTLLRQQQELQHKEKLKDSPFHIELEPSIPVIDAQVSDVCVQIDTLVFVGATLLSQSE